MDTSLVLTASGELVRNWILRSCQLYGTRRVSVCVYVCVWCGVVCVGVGVFEAFNLTVMKV